jgi:MFS family permease
MLSAVLIGMLFDRFVKVKKGHFTMFTSKVKNSDVILLVLHNCIFMVCHVALFFFIRLSSSYTSALIVAMVIGFTYSWNTSVSRGVMAKLLPPEKRVKFCVLVLNRIG